MAKKTTLNLENLNALGVERLARLVIDASARDAGFKKYVVAALASANGPEAIAALIDQRLGALERARSFVEWDRARTFASDLSMTVHAIVDELGPAQPALAVERLLRFIATYSGVFERIDDSQGRVQTFTKQRLMPWAYLLPRRRNRSAYDFQMSLWPSSEKRRMATFQWLFPRSRNHFLRKRWCVGILSSAPNKRAVRPGNAKMSTGHSTHVPLP